MHLPESLWARVTYIAAWFNLSPPSQSYHYQEPIPADTRYDLQPAAVTPLDNTRPPVGYPFFGAPSSEDGIEHVFNCSYPDMPGWLECSIAENRECWLRHPNGTELGIHTDYERIAPLGIQRNYTITIADNPYNGDGMLLNEAKLIDGIFPGPYIQACWGDTVNVKVINKMKSNGTSIHWHGIRQYNTMHMDGVNGITQCPIAPGDSFTYTWRAWQYGSSWYHSHYSAQYADGVQGPITIHGPSSAAYDNAKKPTIMTDWGHNSAFQAMHKIPKEKDKSYGVKAPSILLNGRGNVDKFSGKNVSTHPIPRPYTLDFEHVIAPGGMASRARRYLLRLINTSFDTTFIFTIDNHWMQVIGADFVPIEPYFTTSVLVGIGQRYHVIVEARPDTEGTNLLPNDYNFWIRTYIATGCGNIPRISGSDSPIVEGYEEVGILRYDNTSTAKPNSKPWQGIPQNCSDEPYEKLIPKRPWYVGQAANDDSRSEAPNTGEWWDINYEGRNRDRAYPLGIFSMDPHTKEDEAYTTFHSFRVDYDKPMFLNLSHLGEWDSNKVVVPENFGDDDWVYLTILGGGLKRSVTSAHPIHLHGHDFALLQQSNTSFNATTWKPSQMKLVNPPRRDVVLVPKEGFVIIAFKADNPGNWLMHCHIARHASEGLSLQILERQADAQKMWPSNSHAAVAAERLCHNWNVWVTNCRNWWHSNVTDTCDKDRPWLPAKGYIFQDDSGI